MEFVYWDGTPMERLLKAKLVSALFDSAGCSENDTTTVLKRSIWSFMFYTVRSRLLGCHRLEIEGRLPLEPSAIGMTTLRWVADVPIAPPDEHLHYFVGTGICRLFSARLLSDDDCHDPNDSVELCLLHDSGGSVLFGRRRGLRLSVSGRGEWPKAIEFQGTRIGAKRARVHHDRGDMARLR